MPFEKLNSTEKQRFVTAVETIGTALKYLGNGESGVIDSLGVKIKNVGDSIEHGTSFAGHEIAEALLKIAGALNNVADAIDYNANVTRAGLERQGGQFYSISRR